MLRRVKPSRCVDARAENEADVIRCHVFRLDALRTDQLLQAEVLRFMERPKAGFYKNPVFSLQIHHITDRRNGDKFQKAEAVLLWKTCFRLHRLDQFPCDGRTAEARKRIGTVFLFRIDNRVRRRQDVAAFSVFILLKRNLVVVRHDNRHAELFCQTDLTARRDAVVAGDDRVPPLIRGKLHKMLI